MNLPACIIELGINNRKNTYIDETRRDETPLYCLNIMYTFKCASLCEDEELCRRHYFKSSIMNE